ncbi:MAG: hypothetical protein ACJAR1_000060 [Rubritalea sp.]|jgi:hypothetical protein
MQHHSNKELLTQILTATYPVTPLELEPLASRICEIEGFFVKLEFIKPPANPSDYTLGKYNYERAMSGKATVAKWLETRISPNFPNLKVSLVNGQGSPLQSDDLISYATGSSDYSHKKIYFTVSSPKDKFALRREHLDEAYYLLRNLPCFTSVELEDKPHLFRFWKVDQNLLLLETKILQFRDYEFDALQEIIEKSIKHFGLEVEVYDDPCYGAEELPSQSRKVFRSRQLNRLVKSKGCSDFKKFAAKVFLP